MAQTMPQVFIEKAQSQPAVVAQLSKDGKGVFQPTTYVSLLNAVSAFAAGLSALGASRGDKIGLIADNRKEWLTADLAIMSLGAADVPRGCDATVQEIAYILSWSECRLAILENEKQLKKILEARSTMPQLEALLLFDPAEETAVKEAAAQGLAVHLFETVLENGKKYLASHPDFYKRSEERRVGEEC